MYLLTQFALAIIFISIAAIFYRKNYVWWEYLLQLVIPIGIVMAMYHITTHARVMDTEYWGNTIVTVTHQERYERWDPCKSTYSCNCRTDSNGNETCDTCCDPGCVSYGPYYHAINENGLEIMLSEADYRKIANKFKNEKNTGKQKGDSCKKGYLYEAKWDGEYNTYQIHVTKHRYENKVRHNKIFVPESVTKKEKSQTYPYPSISGVDQVHIIGEWHDDYDKSQAEHRLDFHNGMYGPRPRDRSGQIKVFILLFKDQPKSVARLQKGLWQRGNKNEYTLMLGWDSKTQKISWYDDMTFEMSGKCSNRIKKYVYDNPDLKLEVLASEMSNILAEHWLRREFTPLNALIKLDPPKWLWVVGILLGIVLGILGLFIFTSNEYDKNG